MSTVEAFGDHRGVADHDVIGFEPVAVRSDKLFEVDAGDLLFAFGDHFDVQRQLAGGTEQRVYRLPVQCDLPFIVGRSTSQQLTVLPDGFEWRRLPQLQGIDRLDIIVAVEKNRRLARRPQPVGNDHRVSGRVDDLGILQPDPLVLLGEVAGGAAHVAGVFRLARNARDTEKVLELAQALLARLVEEFLRRRHRGLS
jgi:hypothetical protein